MITTCSLQHFFVQCRTKSAEEAVASVGAVLAEMRASREEDEADLAAQRQLDAEKKQAKKKGGAEEEEEEE